MKCLLLKWINTNFPFAKLPFKRSYFTPPYPSHKRRSRRDNANANANSSIKYFVCVFHLLYWSNAIVGHFRMFPYATFVHIN